LTSDLVVSFIDKTPKEKQKNAVAKKDIPLIAEKK
jgi:hypothetical protein